MKQFFSLSFLKTFLLLIHGFLLADYLLLNVAASLVIGGVFPTVYSGHILTNIFRIEALYRHICRTNLITFFNSHWTGTHLHISWTQVWYFILNCATIIITDYWFIDTWNFAVGQFFPWICLLQVTCVIQEALMVLCVVGLFRQLILISMNRTVRFLQIGSQVNVKKS